jgi:heptosyltransferase-2
MKLAVFLPNWVGDAVMATPALTAIRTDFPEAHIVGVMRPVIADVLAGSGLIDTPLLYHPRGKQPEQRGWRFIRRLRAERGDTAILFPNSLRSAWLAWLSGARRRIGFDRDLRGWLLTDRVPPQPKSTPHPALDEYNRLAEQLGCTSLSSRMTLAVADTDRTLLNTFWDQQPRGLRDRGVVAINTGGAFGPAKNWPRESFAELARRIVDELSRTVLIVCGPAERDEAQWIAVTADRQEVVTLASRWSSAFRLCLSSAERAKSSLKAELQQVPLSIGLTKAAIQSAELLVTTDSGPRHFAAAFDVPVVTLFGPTHIAWSETHYLKATHLQIAVDCGPCQQRECPLGHHRCMRDLTVDQVFAAVQRQLSSHRHRRIA